VLHRTEGSDRRQAYSVHSYATREPSGSRYGAPAGS